MKYLIELFWEWIKLNPLEYSQSLLNQSNGVAEDHFPHMVELQSYAKKIVDQNFLANHYIDDLLTIMAIDNESENTLDYIRKNSSEEQICKIIKKGTNHLQPNARWQIAELIQNVQKPEHIKFLHILAQDKNDYVRKRATNCIKAIEKTTK